MAAEPGTRGKSVGPVADHSHWHVRKAVLIHAHGRAASPLMRRACSPSHRRRLTRWQDRSRKSWSLEDPMLFTTSASPTSCAVRRRHPHGQVRQLSASRVCRGHGGSCASPCRTLADATLDTPRHATGPHQQTSTKAEAVNISSELMADEGMVIAMSRLCAVRLTVWAFR